MSRCRWSISSSTLRDVASWIGGRRVLQVDLDLGPHAGERRAQLVGGVGHEALLAPVGVVESVEHRVHRRGEAGDLVVARRLGHAAVERRSADPGDLGADALDGPQGAPDEHEHDRRRAGTVTSGTHDGQRHGQRAGWPRRCRRAGTADVDDEVSVAGAVDAPRDEAERSVARRRCR